MKVMFRVAEKLRKQHYPTHTNENTSASVRKTGHGLRRAKMDRHSHLRRARGFPQSKAIVIPGWGPNAPVVKAAC